MKRLLILLLLLPLFTWAQDNSLQVEGTSPNLYLIHRVVAKENYYSIGRLYNISPKVFAPYNNLTLDKPLSLGQTIKIPLNDINFSQGGSVPAGEVLVPVYHKVKDKEGLYHISEKYNKVPVAKLRQWNKLANDIVDDGINLVVGYLKVKKDLSEFASKTAPSPANSEPLLQTHPAINKPAPEEETRKEETTLPKPVERTLQQEDISRANQAPVETTAMAKEFNGGVFKADYKLQTSNKDIVKESGTAAIFKSTSGWDDGKYYCLHNTAKPGTIIKVTNLATGKSIYAKALDIIPDIKQNAGLLIRVSNAAAQQLGVNEDTNFDCILEYSK